MKAMTAAPSAQTIVSLPVSPLLQMVGNVAQATSSAIWPAIASVLIFRMAPAPGLRRQPLHDGQDAAHQELARVVAGVANILIQRTAGIVHDKDAIAHVRMLTCNLGECSG
jgi:hypothetical protein